MSWTIYILNEYGIPVRRFALPLEVNDARTIPPELTSPPYRIVASRTGRYDRLLTLKSRLAGVLNWSGADMEDLYYMMLTRYCETGISREELDKIKGLCKTVDDGLIALQNLAS